MKLYKHTTDGGAEYLCLAPVKGTDEGDMTTAIIRLDGRPETTPRLDNTLKNHTALFETLLGLVNVCLHPLSKKDDMKRIAQEARTVIIKSPINLSWPRQS